MSQNATGRLDLLLAGIGNKIAEAFCSPDELATIRPLISQAAATIAPPTSEYVRTIAQAIRTAASSQVKQR